MPVTMQREKMIYREKVPAAKDQLTPDGEGRARMATFMHSCAAGLGAFLIYLPGLARNALPGDSSLYLLNAHKLNLNGYAQSHPLFIATTHSMLKMLPGSPAPLSGALVACFCAAVVAGLSYAIAHALTHKAWVGWATALAVTLSHSSWYHASFAEVYSMNTMFLAAALYCCILWHGSFQNRYLFAAAMFLGLGCSNHLLSALSGASIGIWAIRVLFPRDRKRLPATVACGVAGGILGASLLIALVARDAAQVGLGQAIQLALTGGGGIEGDNFVNYGGRMLDFSLRAMLKRTLVGLALVPFNLPGLGFFLLIPGSHFLFSQRKAIGTLMASLIAIHFFFAATYAIHEFWAFFTPAIFLCCLVAGLGTHSFLKFVTNNGGPCKCLCRPWIFSLLLATGPVACYWSLPVVLHHTHPGNPAEMARQGKVLDSLAYYRYYLWPPRTSQSGDAEWLLNVMSSLPPGSPLMLRSGHRTMARYFQEIRHIRSDLKTRRVSGRAVAEELAKGNRVFLDSLKLLDDLPDNTPEYHTRQAFDCWEIAPANVPNGEAHQ